MVNEFFNEFFVKDKIEKSSSDFYFESSLLIESLSGKISEYGEITRNLRNKIKCLKIEIKDLKYKAEIKELRNNNINLDSGYDSSSKFSTPLSSQPTSPRSKRNLGRFARSNSIDSTLSNPYGNPLFNQIIQQVINKVDKYGEGILDKILNSLNLIGKKIDLRDICSNNHDREIISFFDKNNSNLGEESDNCSKLNKEILAGLFEDFDTSNKKMEISNYNFGERVLNLDLSLKEWLNNEFKIGSFTFNNKRFNPKAITSDYKLFLGTGTGKSTFLPRCIAAHNNGCTIVVHDNYLIGSILHAHNKWLSKGNLNPSEENYDERVINCPICGENHSKIEDGQKRAYETIHNGPSKSINVFTWNNFASALCDSEKREWIKQVVIFDEAHVDYQYYKETIELFISYRDKLNKDYKIIQTSATFSDLPSSLVLKGKINDFYVNPEKIREFCEKNPGFLSKKIVIFCSEFSKLNFKILDDNKIKYLILNEDLKDFASEMTRSTDAKLVIADSSYSMGLSPGDVNVISTGISHLENVIKNERGDFKFERMTLESSFSDIFQQRGRSARESNFSESYWICFIESSKLNKLSVTRKQKMENKSGCIKEAFKEYSKLLNLDSNLDLRINETMPMMNKLCKLFSEKYKVDNKSIIKDEDGIRYLKNILEIDIFNQLDRMSISNLKYEMSITSEFLEYLKKVNDQENFIKSVLFSSARKIMLNYLENYENNKWNFIFENKEDAKWILFLLLISSGEYYDLKIRRKKILVMTFNKEKINSKLELVN